MDGDDLPRRSRDLLTEMSRQDLDPLSVDELRARITALEAEIVRTAAKIDGAVHHRASADALFRS